MICGDTRSNTANVVKSEFHTKALLLNYEEPEHFATSQWILIRNDTGCQSRGCISAFLTYRWLLALFYLAAICISITEPRYLGKAESGQRRAKWPLYLTNWAFVIITCQLLLATFLATKHHLALGESAKTMTYLHKMYWVLHNISNAIAPCITLGYWIVLYNPSIHIIDFTNVASHIVNTSVTLIDLFVVAHPIHLLHFYQPALAGIAYITFSSAYFLAGGTNRDKSPNIYPIINWGEHPWRTLLIAFGAIVLLLLVHFFVWLLYLLRCRIATSLVKPKPREILDIQSRSANI